MKCQKCGCDVPFHFEPAGHVRILGAVQLFLCNPCHNDIVQQVEAHPLFMERMKCQAILYHVELAAEAGCIPDREELVEETLRMNSLRIQQCDFVRSLIPAP